MIDGFKIRCIETRCMKFRCMKQEEPANQRSSRMSRYQKSRRSQVNNASDSNSASANRQGGCVQDESEKDTLRSSERVGCCELSTDASLGDSQLGLDPSRCSHWGLKSDSCKERILNERIGIGVCLKPGIEFCIGKMATNLDKLMTDLKSH